jgi:hypothetical protein
MWLVAAVFSQAVMQGQSGQGITGHINDEQGASIPSVSIVVSNEATGEKKLTDTTKSGDYTVPYLVPGLYSVAASKQGFTTQQREHIAVNVDRTVAVDLVLAVGSVQQTITVTADNMTVEIEKADRGELIDNDRIVGLPLDANNPLALFGLTAGAEDRSKQQWTRPFDNMNQNQYTNGSGQTAIQNLDGATNDNQSNFNGFVPGTDAVQEYKVITNPYDAQYGRAAGGAVDIQLKSGTNAFHGNVYEYMRRKWLDSNTWSNNYNGIGKPNHHRDQYGIEADGPVRIPFLYNGRDKTFFLIQFEELNDTVPSTQGTTSSIPPTAWLGGDFSSATYYNSVTKSLQPLIIYDPLTPLTTVVDPHDGKTKQMHSAFPGNIIPTARLDPVGKNIASHFAAVTPNVTPGAGYAPYQNNFYFLPTELDTYHSGLVKVDHNLGVNDRITARWGWQERFESANVSGFPVSDAASYMSHQVQPKANTFFLEELHTFSANTIMDNKIVAMTEVQGTWSHNKYPGIMAALGFSSHFLSNTQFGDYFPGISTSGFDGMSASGLGTVTNVHTLAYQPSVAHIMSRHTLKFGVDARWQQLAQPQSGNGNSFAFTTTWTGAFYNATDPTGYASGSAVASLLLGYPNSGGVNIPYEPFFSQHYLAPWIQDDFKVRKNLTLNLGLRWDLLGARTERFNKMNYDFNPAVINPVTASISGTNVYQGGIEFTGINGNPRGVFQRGWTNIQPRFGAAYLLNPKTSLRGGFGIMFFNTQGTDSSAGFSSSTSYTNSLNNGLTPYGNLADPMPAFVQPTGASLGYETGLGANFTFYNPRYKLPHSYTYSVTVQRELTRNDVVDISYSGNQAFGQDSPDNLNHISASLQATCDVERGGNRQNCDNASLGQVANPFYQVSAFSGTSDYTTSTISKLTMSEPYPIFGTITENGLPLFHTWYNSLQVNANHKMSHGSSVHAAYTYSKTIDGGDWKDTVNRVVDRYIDTYDSTQILSVSGIYMIPVGRGQRLFGNMNRITDELVGGWGLASKYLYMTGFPWFPSGNWEWNQPVGVSRQTIAPGSTALPAKYSRLRGVTPCAGYKDTDTGQVILGAAALAVGCTSAEMVLAPNSYAVTRQVTYWGARLPPNEAFDMAIDKQFKTYYEGIGLRLRLDALNVLNHPVWQNTYNSTISSLDFGTQTKGPTSPTNQPRMVQISAKLSW